MAPTHLLTLSYDDGFTKSFTLAAKIAEEFGVKAQLNVIAQACTPGAYTPADEYHNAPVGDWALWNELSARGHEIGPHSWSHRNHRDIPFSEAQEQIDKCLDAFTRNLKGFNAANAVYNMPYNASSPAVEQYLDAKVRAVRTSGSALNPFPSAGTRRLGNEAFGPGNGDTFLEDLVERWLKAPSGWLIYNTHGFDEEGWGPVTPDCVRRLYARLLKLPHVRIVTQQEGLSLGAKG
jgi:peptidoglycan/xylan/chitin deacetylase (PgdA/CDA1 family)